MFGLYRLIFLAFIVWFTPWVLMLNVGVVAYRPYEANGIDRYYRLAGPVAQIFTNVGWTTGSHIPESCKHALVIAEDFDFYRHSGIDFKSIKAAMKRNKKKGKPVWGGSTITQQLVKNIFLSRDRTYLRKAREATGALMLDVAMAKNDQIVWYFNVVEFGPRIYGIGDAARYYFGREPQNLTAHQCMKLVSILPAPKRYHQLVKNGKTTPYLGRRIDHLRVGMEKFKQPTG